MRINFKTLSTAHINLNKALTFQSAEVSLGGTWVINAATQLSATAQHIIPLGESATRAEITGSVSGGTVNLAGYDSLVVQPTADVSSTVQFTGNQVDFYGANLDGATLNLEAPTIAAHLD